MRRRTFLALLFGLTGYSSKANIYVVTDTTASSPQSLAYAIVQANANFGRDTIEFNIPGLARHNIIIDSVPIITDILFINGLSQPGNIATDFYNTNLHLVGSIGLMIRSPGCEIKAVAFFLYNNVSSFAISIIPDSAKSISNTVVKRVSIENGIAVSKGILIDTDSSNGLANSNILFDSVHIHTGSSALSIRSSGNSDITSLTITNCELASSYFYFNSIVEDTALMIHRQNNLPLVPVYKLENNFIAGQVNFSGYLDSIQFRNNRINSCYFSIHDCSINNSMFEQNYFTDGPGTSCSGYNPTIYNFLGDSIHNIQIQSNTFEYQDLHFDFTGNDQFFRDILFQYNGLSTSNAIFEKSNTSNPDSQVINNLVIKNNYTSSIFGYDLNLRFLGNTRIKDILVINNSIAGPFGGLTIETDSNSDITTVVLDSNNINVFYGNINGDIVTIKLQGETDTLSIDYCQLLMDDGYRGINMNSTGKISWFTMNDNYISVEGFATSAIFLANIHAVGEIKYNELINNQNYGIYSSEYYTDSNTIIAIDSNTIHGMSKSGIAINKSPYNPPQQQIGIYTMLGNSIFNIGKEGIYRSSQHDTSSCMTCIPKPVLLYGECFNGITMVNGSLTGDTLTSYIIEFFSNSSPDTGGYTEGHTFIHRDTITTDAAGNAIFSSTIQGNFLDSFITSTATSMVTYQTSEFSNETGVVLGTTDTNNETEITVFPNPVSQDLFVYSPTLPIFQIEVIDLLGKRTRMELSDPHSNKINMENLLPGFYFLEIHFADKTIVKKILKK